MYNFIKKIMYLLIVSFFIASKAFAFISNNITVTDGDTIRMDGERIRIWGIDAPELKQSCLQADHSWFCGIKAREAFLKFIEGASLRCEVVHKDRYSRKVSRCFIISTDSRVNGKDIGAEMVRSGWALDYERYSRGTYALEQEEARRAERGIWSGKFDLPWEWRRHKNK